MRITIEVTKGELEESGFDSIEDMKESLYEDLDNQTDYPGYTIYIEVIETCVL